MHFAVYLTQVTYFAKSSDWIALMISWHYVYLHTFYCIYLKSKCLASSLFVKVKGLEIKNSHYFCGHHYMKKLNSYAIHTEVFLNRIKKITLQVLICKLMESFNCSVD